MLRRFALVVAVLFLALSAFAQKDLKSRADAASGGERAKLAVEYTEEAAKAADKAFNDGKDDEGSAKLKEVAQYAKVAADASMQSGKREKDTEIKLRKVLKRLVEVKQAQPFEQQAEVQKVIDAVQAAHDALLESMFKKNH
jgi:SpoVK/Ycf46/Vps4 family AAA+-type ATPase